MTVKEISLRSSFVCTSLNSVRKRNGISIPGCVWRSCADLDRSLQKTTQKISREGDKESRGDYGSKLSGLW